MDSRGIFRFNNDRDRDNCYIQYIGSGWSYFYCYQFRRVYFDTDINSDNKFTAYSTCSTNSQCHTAADLFGFNRNNNCQFRYRGT